MSDTPTPGTLFIDRMKYWWSVYLVAGTIIGALAGSLSVGLAKFTVYYLAEESSVQTLVELKATHASILTRLQSIEDTLKEHHYTDLDLGKSVNELNIHVHALDERADTNWGKIADSIAIQTKNSQQILLLLQPQPKGK